MGLTVERAKSLLKRLRIPVDDGLSEREFRRIEGALGFTFSPDHRALLASGLPRGGRWPDWRGETLATLKDRLSAPVDGVLFDVEENGFWRASWGTRPADTKAALRLAGVQMKKAPILVPIYGHRYSPALPQPGLPVFSVVQTDVIIYGTSVEDYLGREFGSVTATESAPTQRVPFWSDLVSGAVEGIDQD